MRPLAARLVLVAAPVIAAVAATLLATGGAGSDPFPHEAHSRLFPICTGCHEGVVTGDTTTFYPPAVLCVQCHDGERSDLVDWTGRVPRPTSLVFSHLRHPVASGDRLACLQCHSQSPEPEWMEVNPLLPETCITCHDGPASEHLAPDSDCRFCHLPLADSPLPLARIAAFPLPQDHEAPDFVQNHGVPGEQAVRYCAVCHSRDSCERCHLNSTREPAIAVLQPDARVAELLLGVEPVHPLPAGHEEPAFIHLHGGDAATSVQRCAICHARESCERCHLNTASLPAIVQIEPNPAAVARLALGPAHYPLPDDHRDAEWMYRHGRDANTSIDGCANCHAQQSCRTCHLGPGGAGMIGRLPVPPESGPYGAIVTGLAARPPSGAPARADGRFPLATAERHSGASTLYGIPNAATRSGSWLIHPPGFEREHRTAAAGDQPRCSVCHTSQYCADCHEGASRPRFHPPNYLSRHGADVYSARSECSACHSTQAFCRTCHESAGISSRGRTDTGFHSAQPLWLLRHAQAARQNLHSCTSCHAQQDCLQCHSQMGWGVSPHGPGFDAIRMRERNPQMCARCHIGGGAPGRR